MEEKTETKNITLKNFFDKCSHSSAAPEEQEGKMVMSNGAYVQSIIMLKLIEKIEHLRLK